MQMQSLLLFLIILTSLIVAPRVNAIYQSSSKPSIRPSYRTALRPEIDGLQNSALIIISNDGPTVLGSKTVFNIAVIAPPGFYLSFQWGTFIPYIWKTVRTYKYTERLEVNWWKSTGLKKVNFYIDALKPNASSWTRIAQNSSSIQVNDHISITVLVYQNGRLITDGNLHTGVAKMKATIHDPGGFFKGTVISYTWVLNDKSQSTVTTVDNIEHTFTTEGLFFVQISASLKKDGRVYNGKTSFYLKIKGKLDGYILAWKEDDHHPTLPSREKSLPLGLVNFQFQLVDKYSSFAGATFFYVWNFGDGIVTKNATANETHVYDKLGLMNIALDVNAEKNGITYHNVIYKNISIRAPIKDLDVKSHSKLKKGITVQFNVTCRGSSPVSFCWYVTRGSCQLPSDVICSPTRLYHHCRNTINHTFHHTGGYCVNVTVMNTVSFAEKSININVDGDEPSGGGKSRFSIFAVAVLPIIGCLLLLVAFFVGIKYKMQHRRRLARKTEVATFDFRSSQYSLNTGEPHCSPRHITCPSFWGCRRLCPFDDDIEAEHEMEERRMCRDGDRGPTTPQRKTSYYGSIHMILGQSQTRDSINRDSTVAIAEEDLSPPTSHRHLSKSV